jgi:hypothetical protein
MTNADKEQLVSLRLDESKIKQQTAVLCALLSKNPSDGAEHLLNLYLLEVEDDFVPGEVITTTSAGECVITFTPYLGGGFSSLVAALGAINV